MIRGPLNTPFEKDMKEAPSPHDRAGVAEAGNPGCVSDPKNDFGVLSPTFYMKTEALNWSPGALNSPFGTAIVNTKPRSGE